MGRIIPLVLVLILAATQALAALENAKGHEECKNPKQGVKLHLFDYYVLTLHSRGGYCELNSCKKIPAGQTLSHPPLTIKGLMYRMADGAEGPVSCMDVAFDINKLALIKSDLTHYWPSFNASVTNEDLWKEHVEKYGSCKICQDQSQQENGVRIFLDTVLNENRLWSIFSYFSKAGIEQSNEKPVLLQNLKDAFKGNKFNMVPEFDCKGTKNNWDILQEVRVCWSATDLTYSKCPSTEQPTCHTEQIWYLGNLIPVPSTDPTTTTVPSTDSSTTTVPSTDSSTTLAPNSNSSITHVPCILMVIFAMLFAYLIPKSR